MFQERLSALTLAGLLALSGIAAASDWHEHSGVWGNTFKVYTLTRGNNDIRFGLENISNQRVDVGSIDVRYQCSGGGVDTKTHYFSHTYSPGEKSAFVGFDTVCRTTGGIQSWEITSCSGDGGPCY